MPQFVLQGRDDVRLSQLDAFTIAYIEAAFFTEEEQLGTDDASDLDDATLAKMIFDCARFQRRAALDEMPDDVCRGSIAEQAGHDFWLTRNGHGAGFWDGDWAEPYADCLDRLSKSFSQVDLYTGDDGKVYDL